MKKYIKPINRVVEVNLNDTCMISQSAASEYLHNKNWYYDNGHIYNPGGKDMCPEGSHEVKSSIWDNEW